MVISSIVEEGDEVLYLDLIILHMLRMCDYTEDFPVEFSVDLNNSTPDFDDIKSKITSKTVAICLISPNNPTGVVFNEMHSKTSRYC